MKKLDRFISEKQIDECMIPLIKIINSREGYYTTSCCSGRIAIIELDKTGDKLSANFIGKWHFPPDIDDVWRAVLMCKKYSIFRFDSPIIHICCKDLEHAKNLIVIAIDSGWKQSFIKSISRKIVVELKTSEVIETPIFVDKLIVTKEYMGVLIAESCAKLKMGHEKIRRIINNLRDEYDDV